MEKFNLDDRSKEYLACSFSLIKSHWVDKSEWIISYKWLNLKYEIQKSMIGFLDKDFYNIILKDRDTWERVASCETGKFQWHAPHVKWHAHISWYKLWNFCRDIYELLNWVLSREVCDPNSLYWICLSKRWYKERKEWSGIWTIWREEIWNQLWELLWMKPEFLELK